MILKIVYLVQALMIKCWYCWSREEFQFTSCQCIEESFNSNLPSKFSRVFKCVRFFFAWYKKQYGGQVKSAHDPLIRI